MKTQAEIENPKPEIRNPKEIRSPKSEKAGISGALVGSVNTSGPSPGLRPPSPNLMGRGQGEGPSGASDFGFRISDFIVQIPTDLPRV